MNDERYSIRLETEADHRQVEELTRDAFWNKYHPGCSEHYILHRYRSRPEFVSELNCVAEEAGRVVAHIMYSRADILCADNSRLPCLIFGPVSVTPQRQGQGLGGAIIRYTLERAKALGWHAVVITGDPGYYHRFGFVSGQSKGIAYAGAPQGEDFPYFMVKELTPGFLDGITGVFSDPEGYCVTEAEVDAFDRRFPPREKQRLPGQLD